LCANCGAELNIAECACSQDNMNLKFNALKNVKVK